MLFRERIRTEKTNSGKLAVKEGGENIGVRRRERGYIHRHRHII